MIALLKVCKTLYQNDEHEILYVLIMKSKFSDHFFKNVLLPYSMTQSIGPVPSGGEEGGCSQRLLSQT